MKLIQEPHDTALAGHSEQAATFDLFDWQYYWTILGKQVDECESNWNIWQRSRSTQHSTFAVLQISPVPDKPWEDISMDSMVGLQECIEFDTIWVVLDSLSKMRHCIPCNTMMEATGLAKLFSRQLVCLYELRATVVSDWGSQFASTFWGWLCYSLRFELIVLTPFHPQKNIQSARTNECEDGTVSTCICQSSTGLQGWMPSNGWVCWE